MDLVEAFKYNIILLKTMGLWIFPKNSLYTLFTCYVQSSLVFDSSFLIIYVAKNIGKKNVTDTIYSLPGTLQVVMKAIWFRKNFVSIKQTLDNLNRTEFQPKNIRQEQILQKSLKLSSKVFWSFFSLVSAMISIWMIIPLTKSGKVLPTKYWIPFDYKKAVIYELLYIFECACIILHGFSNVALDTFFAIAMVQIGAQCDLLCDAIKSMKEPFMVKQLNERIYHYKLIKE